MRNLESVVTRGRAASRRASREVAAFATVVAAPPLLLSSLFLESRLKSDRIVEFEPLESGQFEEPTEEIEGDVFLPYGSTAKVVFEGEFEGDPDIEGLVLDMKDSRDQARENRKYASAKLIWGKRVVTKIKEGGRKVHSVEGMIGSAKIEKTTVVIPELDATLEHFRPPRGQY